MIRSKREWLCTNCHARYIKWQGFCRCGDIGKIVEVSLGKETLEANRETDEQRRLRLRAKRSERAIAKRMTNIDGADPAWSRIASSTGRIGHISGIRADAVSMHYIIENKNRKLPIWIINAWILINQKGIDFDKHVLLHLEPPNMPREIPINGTKEKLDTMAVITQGRHEELIVKEHTLALIEEAILSGKTNVGRIRTIIEESKSSQNSN
jgi:hypothetical protein